MYKYLLFLILFFSTGLWSHSVNVFAEFVGSEIVVRGYFTKGQPIVGAKVSIVGKGDNSIAAGVTDGEGYFRFLPELREVTKLNVILDAGTGHLATFGISEQELLESEIRIVQEKNLSLRLLFGLVVLAFSMSGLYFIKKRFHVS